MSNGIIGGPNGGQQQPQRIRINPNDLDSIACETCDGEVFIEASLIKRMSALQSPTGEEAYLPIPVFVCNDCGEINKEMLQQR